jgi:hypothetical protein
VQASPNQFEAPPKEYQKEVLCGEKLPHNELAGSKTFRNWVRYY